MKIHYQCQTYGYSNSAEHTKPVCFISWNPFALSTYADLTTNFMKFWLKLRNPEQSAACTNAAAEFPLLDVPATLTFSDRAADISGAESLPTFSPLRQTARWPAAIHSRQAGARDMTGAFYLGRLRTPSSSDEVEYNEANTAASAKRVQDQLQRRAISEGTKGEMRTDFDQESWAVSCDSIGKVHGLDAGNRWQMFSAFLRLELLWIIPCLKKERANCAFFDLNLITIIYLFQNPCNGTNNKHSCRDNINANSSVTHKSCG